MDRDTQDFLDLLNTLDKYSFAPARELFNTKADLFVSRAPGRLDVMGGIADYSGSHVLEFPIAEATFVALQLNDNNRLNVVTLLDDEPHHSSFTMSLITGRRLLSKASTSSAEWPMTSSTGSTTPTAACARGTTIDCSN